MSKKYNILLTCAGGPAAVSVIKSLRCSKFKDDIKIVAVDLDPLSAGMFLADVRYTTPPIAPGAIVNHNENLKDDNLKIKYSSNWWGVIEEIILKEEINILLQTGDADILEFSQHTDALERLGVFNMIPSSVAINICQDKYSFYSLCKDKFSLPYTTLINEKASSLKYISKPRRGSGSRDIKIYKSDEPVNLPNDYILQSYLSGKEISVDVLCDFNSKLICGVVRERIQTKAGISTKGKIILDDSVLNECAKICKYINLIGPACIQLKQNDSNKFQFIEINPRFGGGLYFSTLAGVNIPEIMLQLFSNETFVVNTPKEIVVVRYFEEIVI